MSQPFDFDKALKALQSGQALTGKDDILTPLIKQLTEAALAPELDSHLAQDVEANRKNGSGRKTVKATTGSFELATPRDRNGTFEPQLVKKHQTTLSDEIEQKIIRLFPEAINSIYPQTEVQLCIIHQIRNSIKYVASKHHKAFMVDLKPVYQRRRKPRWMSLKPDGVSSIRWLSSHGVGSGTICRRTSATHPIFARSFIPLTPLSQCIGSSGS